MLYIYIYKASCQVQWHLLQVHLHAPNPSGLDCNCSTVMLAFLSSTHCSHAGHLEWIDSPQQWFKVTLQTLRKPIENRTRSHKGRHTTSKFAANLLQLRGCFAEWLGFRRRSSLCPGPRDLDATQISHIMPDNILQYDLISKYLESPTPCFARVSMTFIRRLSARNPGSLGHVRNIV